MTHSGPQSLAEGPPAGRAVLVSFYIGTTLYPLVFLRSQLFCIEHSIKVIGTEERSLAAGGTRSLGQFRCCGCQSRTHRYC